MENKKTIAKRIREGLLEIILPLSFALGPTMFYSVQMYHLMEDAGMYRQNENGTYDNFNSGYAFAHILGSTALLMGGLYIGNKITELIKREKQM